MRVVFGVLGFVCFMFVAMFIWEKTNGEQCFWLMLALMVNGITEHLGGYVDGLKKGAE